ncbi:hypothetical protein J2T13_003657 [Paenibacillus sp. DS2015]|uniref:hypothetical protein n=1 Tax=Paenibacillus sp. DS2015 TaxID=3373917 RepID=UPI003D24C7B7
MAAVKLVGMMKDFLDGTLSAELFSFDFPAALLNEFDALEKENKPLSDLLNEDMPEYCSYFEPDENARLQSGDYLDEVKFKEKVTAVYKLASKLT